MSGAERELWTGTFTFVDATEDAGTTDGGGADGMAARRLAILLDVLALQASEPRYVLDERYEALLDADEREAARAARALAHNIRALPKRHDARWSALLEALRVNGVAVDTDPDPDGHPLGAAPYRV